MNWLALMVAIASAIAAGASAWAAWENHSIAQRALAAQRETAVQPVLLAYLTTYEQVADTDANALDTISEYNNTSSSIQRRVQIVAGLLAEVIDAMYYADDKRANTWVCFLVGLPGPVSDGGFQLDAYTTNTETKAAIEKARTDIRLERSFIAQGSSRHRMSQIGPHFREINFAVLVRTQDSIKVLVHRIVISTAIDAAPHSPPKRRGD